MTKIIFLEEKGNKALDLPFWAKTLLAINDAAEKKYSAHELSVGEVL